MEADPRYEIVTSVGTGDFATVYRARDRELGREVAIKQIHQQFLGDPRQLERYWREAQLLASLQHPNILTIYDVVRPRGWLVLELMRGSLAAQAQGDPIDLNYLRAVLICCLRALDFLHRNGIIHGDIKPSNMLVDMQNRVKLGDFGLARRANNEEGSLLKGTTKYIAPELVSNQFGPRGPASDLYSLGFAAYELMCGRQFESLFPGLFQMAPDRQIAWLMWHAAPDRHLPEIARVLEGVPIDLAHVIQNLTVKDQARRYPSAEAALKHLFPGGASAGPPPVQKDVEAEAAEAAEAKRKRKMRIGAVAALSFSLVLCVFMLLPKSPPPAEPKTPAPVHGIVRNVYLGERMLVLEDASGNPVEVAVHPRDEILINDRKQLLRDLQPEDRVSVEFLRDAAGRTTTRVVASRPEVTEGRIAAVDADQEELTLALGTDDQQLVVRVPDSARIVFNGSDQIDGRPMTLADLDVDDRATVSHFAELAPEEQAGGQVATGIDASRVVTLVGTVREVDTVKRELTLASESDPSTMVTLPLAPVVEIIINHRKDLGGRLLKLEDLKPGDRATVSHDARIVRVDAYRILGQAGTIRRVPKDAKSLEVLIEGDSKPTRFLTGPKTKISLDGEPVALDDLRAGDQVDVTHDSPGAENPEALGIAATRPPDPARWAVLVAVQDYEDTTLTPLDTPVADATRLRDALVGRYRVPAGQALLLADPSRVRLEQGVVGLFNRAKSDDQVIVYVAAHAYADDDGRVYLAPKSFQLSRIADSGVALQWLIDEFEKCPARQKLLLLDCTHAGSGDDLKREPSAAEMIASLKAPPGRVALRTVTAIAGTSQGQRGYEVPGKEEGIFASSLTSGFSGEADANRDGRLETTELLAYLERTMKATADQIGRMQAPKLFLPDNTPPRLSEDAKASIRKLAAFLAQDHVEISEVDQEYSDAQKLAGDQPEPKLLDAMLLLKARQRDAAARRFEEVSIANPKLLLPLQATAWLDLDKRAYAAGVEDLTRLVSAIPEPEKPGQSPAYSDEARQIFEWSGRLREFVAGAVSETFSPPETSLQALDAAVAAHISEAGRLYQQGRAHTQQVIAELDRQIASGDEAAKSRARIERRQLSRYASFPYELATKRILAGLDQ